MATCSLVLHLNVTDTGTWNLVAVDMSEGRGTVIPIGGHRGQGFGPEEAELGAALDRLDKVIDPTGEDLALQCWWADAWAAVLANGGFGHEGIVPDALDEAA